MPEPITEPQYRALKVLVDFQFEHGHTPSPRQVAKRLWPDSKAWRERTRMRGERNGAVGGTMPMKAATILWRLHHKGLAYMLDEYTWTATPKGRRLVEERESA